MEKEETQVSRETWGSKFGFLMAAAGSAVGLGNLWRFPSLTGANGGAAFVFIYILFVIIIGMSLTLVEITIGRASGLNPLGAVKKINSKWSFFGFIMLLGVFLMLSYYSVVGGWIINYLTLSVENLFQPIGPNYGAVFHNISSTPEISIFYLSIFLILTAVIVAVGIQKGIERSVKILMPLLFVIIIILMIRSVTLTGASAGIEFFLKPDFSKITWNVVVAAMGQVFMSLSLGIGTLLNYGSYLKRTDNTISYSIQIPAIDTCFSIAAGLMIMPAVFAFGFKPQEGPGLIFETLPAIFDKIPFGSYMMVGFFLLVLFAAISSSISMLEECVTYLVDEKHLTRVKASVCTVIAALLVGIPCSLSFSPYMQGVKIFGRSIFDFMDFFVCSVIMPIGGIFMCCFVGWIWKTVRKPDKSYDLTTGPLADVTNNGRRKFPGAAVWMFLVRYITPALIFIIFIKGLLG